MILHGPAQQSTAQCSPEWTSTAQHGSAQPRMNQHIPALPSTALPRSPPGPPRFPPPGPGLRPPPPAGAGRHLLGFGMGRGGPVGEPPCVGQRGDETGRGEWTDTPPGSRGPLGDGRGGTALAAAHSSVPQFPHCEVGGGHGGGGGEGLVVDAGLVGGRPPGSPSMWGAPGLLQPFPCWLGVQLSLQKALPASCVWVSTGWWDWGWGWGHKGPLGSPRWLQHPTCPPGPPRASQSPATCLWGRGRSSRTHTVPRSPG